VLFRSYLSENGEDEAIISFEDPTLVHQLQDLLEIDTKLARKITVEENPPLFERVMCKFNHLNLSYF
jgi:hypothetical protein